MKIAKANHNKHYKQAQLLIEISESTKQTP